MKTKSTYPQLKVWVNISSTAFLSYTAFDFFFAPDEPDDGFLDLRLVVARICLFFSRLSCISCCSWTNPVARLKSRLFALELPLLFLLELVIVDYEDYVGFPGLVFGFDLVDIINKYFINL